MKFAICTLMFFFALGMNLQANNLQISAVTVTNGGATLEFTISWDNSWRVLAAPANHDAVWLIVKRRDCASIDYRHQKVSADPLAHALGAPLMVTTTNDSMGLFIHRNTPGQGNIVSVPVRITLQNPPPGDYDYKVIGIEMVYVPEGEFDLGDRSATSNNAFYTAPSTVRAPFRVRSEDPIPLVVSTSNIIANPPTLSCSSMLGNGTLSLSYPKGFNAFYAMKYEISLGQYLDFLNSAVSSAAAPLTHGYTTPTSGRNSVTGNYPFYTTTTPNRACDSLSWAGLLAYLDWAALAPMSELEFEKLCRGLNNPSANEYASSAVSFDNINLLDNDGTPNESVAAGSYTNPMNVGNDGTHLGAYRVGFATTASTTLRIETGGSYYGAMELSGNVAERVVGLSSNDDASTASTSFNKLTHGNGELDPNGLANQGWPSEGNLTTVENFAAIRGGAWNMSEDKARVSNRTLITLNHRGTGAGGANLFGRRAGLGGRGLRRAVVGLNDF